MDMIKKLLQGVLNKMETAEQNADNPEESPKKNFIPYIGGAVAVIVVVFLFLGGEPTSPEDIVKKYADISITALNEGEISDDDVKWIGEIFVNPTDGAREAAAIRQTASMNQNIAAYGGSVKTKFKEIKTIHTDNTNCVVGLILETTATRNGNSYVQEAQSKFYLVKLDKWKISRVDNQYIDR